MKILKKILGGSFLILILILVSNFEVQRVNGSSMEPTLQDKQFIIIQLTKNIKIGDIVTIHINYEYGSKSEYIIKRVADIDKDGNIYVLGDNSEISHDSRHYGYIPGDMVQGKLIYSFKN